tara:strand:+ start:177 stop:698 length:522 start_codon:yes stop_codon:yes gene_type:complete
VPGSINQIQIAYSPEEDRILFRVNSMDRKEFRFWLTRRFTVLLVKVLSDHRARDPDVVTQHTPQAKEAVQSFKQEQAVAGADFKQQFSQDGNEYPLGADFVLAHKITYKIEGANLHLAIQPKEGQGINMVLSQDINATVTRLLATAVGQADWRIDGGSPAEPPATTEVPSVIN